jgi:hypothetical protein
MMDFFTLVKAFQAPFGGFDGFLLWILSFALSSTTLVVLEGLLVLENNLLNSSFGIVTVYSFVLFINAFDNTLFNKLLASLVVTSNLIMVNDLFRKIRSHLDPKALPIGLRPL